MKIKISKGEAKRKIADFFDDIKNKTPEEVRKIKKLAMANNIKLGIRKRLYCKKCLHPYIDPAIRIKSGFVNTTCEFCGHNARWKLHMGDPNEMIMPIQKEKKNCKC